MTWESCRSYPCCLDPLCVSLPMQQCYSSIQDCELRVKFHKDFILRCSYIHGDQVDMDLLVNQIAVLIEGWNITPGIPDQGTLVEDTAA